MSLDLSLDVARNLGVATLSGLAVGIERQWSGHASGPGGRFAGARTFLLLGFLGGLSGWLIAGGLVPLGITTLAFPALLTVVSYVMATRHSTDLDSTTEVVALLVLATGAAAGLGFPLLTSAATAVTVLVLVEKSRIHGLIARLGKAEFEAALQFAVLALVVLPLLPEGPFGPFDSIRPRALWIVVLLFSALNFAGYVARRAVGGARGYGITGLVGGLLSSTAVALSFSRLSRDEPDMASPLASGVLASCTVLIPRVLLISAIISSTVALKLLPLVVPPLVVGLGFVVYALFGKSPPVTVKPEHEPESPLQLWSAVKMAVAFQVVLLAIPLVGSRWSATGVIASSAVLGLTDVDALTYTMARLGGTEEAVALAAHAIAVGILSNTVLKLGITLVIGAGTFRRRAAVGLASLALASGIGLLLLRG